MNQEWQITHITAGGHQIGVSNGTDIIWAIRDEKTGEIVFDEKVPLPNYIKSMVERTFKNIHNGRINCSFSKCKFWYSPDGRLPGKCKHINGTRHNLESGEIEASQRGKDGNHSVLRCFLQTPKDDSSFWIVLPYKRD